MNKPYLFEAIADKTYFWCACGLSKDSLFCDGSHKQNNITRPVKWCVQQDKAVHLCGCKETQTPPFCDGAHKKLTTSCISEA